jgi:hypothetical protein
MSKIQFFQVNLYSSAYRSYQSGPIGGGMSKAVNPLMQCAMNPSPTLRMYCSTTGKTISDQICRGLLQSRSVPLLSELRSGVLWTDSCKLITCPGWSSNALPPMLNATVCRESTCLQSTCDPTGSGMFSQSCQSTHLLVRHVWCTNAKWTSDSRSTLTLSTYSKVPSLVLFGLSSLCIQKTTISHALHIASDMPSTDPASLSIPALHDFTEEGY